MVLDAVQGDVLAPGWCGVVGLWGGWGAALLPGSVARARAGSGGRIARRGPGTTRVRHEKRTRPHSTHSLALTLMTNSGCPREASGPPPPLPLPLPGGYNCIIQFIYVRSSKSAGTSSKTTPFPPFTALQPSPSLRILQSPFPLFLCCRPPPAQQGYYPAPAESHRRTRRGVTGGAGRPEQGWKDGCAGEVAMNRLAGRKAR